MDQGRNSVSHEPESVADNPQGQSSSGCHRLARETSAEASKNREKQAIKSISPNAKTTI